MGLVLPLLVLTIVGYILFYYAIEMMDASYEDFSKKFIPIATLQESVLRAVMPPNDYLIHGDQEERRNFQFLRIEADQGFERALAVDFDDPRKNASVVMAHTVWKHAVRLGEDILSMDNPTGNPSGARLMEHLDSLVDEVYDQLEYVCTRTVSEIDNKHVLLHQMYRKVGVVILGFMILLSVVVFMGSVLVKRWIIAPLMELENGAQKLAMGQLEHRIQVTSRDEIGSVARTFNEMAAALSRDRDILHKLSIHDPLTGLLNRKEFQRLLELEITRSQRHGRTMAVLMIDIDYFKVINDRYGHPAGDTVLRSVADRILSALRPNDLVARYGGEEFIVMLPETDETGATAIAERLCTQVRATPFDVTPVIQPIVTVSVGVAVYPHDADSLQGLTEAADKAMYGAKAAGRDRTLQYEKLSKTGNVRAV